MIRTAAKGFRPIHIRSSFNPLSLEKHGTTHYHVDKSMLKQYLGTCTFEPLTEIPAFYYLREDRFSNIPPAFKALSSPWSAGGVLPQPKINSKFVFGGVYYPPDNLENNLEKIPFLKYHADPLKGHVLAAFSIEPNEDSGGLVVAHRFDVNKYKYVNMPIGFVPDREPYATIIWDHHKNLTPLNNKSLLLKLVERFPLEYTCKQTERSTPVPENMVDKTIDDYTRSKPNKVTHRGVDNRVGRIAATFGELLDGETLFK